MPLKYPNETKHKTIGILQIHDDISFTRYATAVHQRALRRWRDQLRMKQNSFMSEKTFQSDIKRTQNQIFAENSAETCQHDAADAIASAPMAPVPTSKTSPSSASNLCVVLDIGRFPTNSPRPLYFHRLGYTPKIQTNRQASGSLVHYTRCK